MSTKKWTSLKIKQIRFTWTASVFVIFEYSFVEEISEMRCVSEWHAKDLQHLIGASIQSHIMLHNGNEAVGTDGSIHQFLYAGTPIHYWIMGVDIQMHKSKSVHIASIIIFVQS